MWYSSQPTDMQNTGTEMVLLATEDTGENERETHQPRKLEAIGYRIFPAVNQTRILPR